MTTTILPAPPGAHGADAEGAERRATWLELFFDLVFAAAVGAVGSALSTSYGLEALGQFAFLFFLIWWAWAGHTFFATRFDTDDVWDRLLTVGQMFAVAVMAANTETNLASREAAGFAAAYAAMRLLLCVQYLRVPSGAPGRLLARRYAAGIGVASVLWLASSIAPAPGRYVLWAAALLLDVLTPLLAERRTGRDHPPDRAHLPERFGLFTLIFLGEFVVATMAGMRMQDTWTTAAAAAAILGMALTFSLWWAYFDALRAAFPTAAWASGANGLGLLWAGAHLPLAFGIALVAIGVEHVIILNGTEHLHGAAPWLLTGGLAVILVALGVIGLASACRRTLPARRRVLRTHVLLAVAIFGFAWIAGAIPSVWVVAALFVASLLAIAFTRRMDAAADCAST